MKVAYCAEQFDNDGTMMSNILKNLKRVMAAEYSPELSVKVHAGASRSARTAFLLAAHALRKGRVRTALAVAARGRSATCAVLLQREEGS